MRKSLKTSCALLAAVLMTLVFCAWRPVPADYTVERADVTSSGLLSENIVVEMFVPVDRQRNGATIIMCHGLTGCRENFRDYADRLAADGCTVCIFDFRGGGNECESEGSTATMSVITELQDLTDVFGMVESKDYVDPSRIFLLGHSQGGLVASLFAAENPDKVAGMFLMAPAYNIPDAIRENFPEKINILPVFPVEDMILGYFYAYDIYDMDVYSEIQGYDGPVLIVHGSEDTTVPESYITDALGCYSTCKFISYEGCDHIFSDQADKDRAYSDLYALLTPFV